MRAASDDIDEEFDDSALADTGVFDECDDLYMNAARRVLRRRLFDEEPEPIRIGRYHVLAPLAAGAMGRVYLGEDPRLGRRVAIKLVGRDDVAPEVRARFVREGRALALVNHPNVVSVYDVGVHGEHPFIAMEYVPGTTLAKWLAVAPRTWREVIEAYVSAGRGLVAAHAAGLVHRDFKPANVIVSDDHRIVVVDFGLARRVESAPDRASDPLATITSSGTRLGTPAYMSPEQMAGISVNEHSDQFSFCAALYAALFGHAPFHGERITDLFEAIHDGPIAPAASSTPDRVLDLLMRGLCANPDARFDSLEELLEELERVVATRHRKAELCAATWADPLANQAHQPSEPTALGSCVASRYTLHEELGSGGFATVSKATDLRLRRTVALKVLRPLSADSDVDLARFEREVRILASLDHPHIVPIYDAGVDDRRPFFAMKLADGPSLRERLDRGPLSEVEALEIAEQLADATAHAHARGVLHRDIKPANVLSDSHGSTLLADFGISHSNSLPRVTAQDLVLGTMQYMAPEALSGRATEQGDIYSLGVVLHEMLFGQRCFAENSPTDLLDRIFHEPPPLLSEPPFQVSSSVVFLLRRMLAKDPAKRPESAAVLVIALRELRQSRTGPAAEQGDHLADTLVGELSLSDELDQLEACVGSFGRACDRDPLGADAVLEHLSEFIGQGSSLVSRLRAAEQLGGSAGLVLAVGLSLGHLGSAVEARLTLLEQSGSTTYAGYLVRLRNSVLVPASRLVSAVHDRSELDPEDDEFLAPESTEEFSVAPQDDAWIDDLYENDELKRHAALVRLVNDGLDTFLHYLSGAETTERDCLLDGLWQHADNVLIEGRGRSRCVVEVAIDAATDPEIAERWRTLFGLFHKVEGQYLAPDLVTEVLGRQSDDDARILRRCLLAHPSPAHRKLALETLEPSDCWEVIAHPSTPFPVLLAIWRHIRPRVGADFLKLFFVCVRDTLEHGVDSDAVVDAVDMVKEFYRVDAFHEDVFFRMLMGLDARVRERARSHGLLINLDSEYHERFQRFTAEGSRPNQPLESCHAVPLPIQRRIARLGLFLRHFACHPKNPIALECFPHLVIREDISGFLEDRRLNGKLLEELAKEKHLFRRDGIRYLLLAHPKVPPYMVSKYMRGLRKDFLRKLSRSRDCSLNARMYAERLVAARGRQPRR